MEPREVCRAFRCTTSTSKSLSKFLDKVDQVLGCIGDTCPLALASSLFSFCLLFSFLFLFSLRLSRFLCFSPVSLSFLLSPCLCFCRCLGFLPCSFAKDEESTEMEVLLQKGCCLGCRLDLHGLYRVSVLNRVKIVLLRL